MVVQPTEEPNSILPPVDEPVACKVQSSSDSLPSSESANSCFSGASGGIDSLHVGPGRWASCVSLILTRTDELGQYVRELIAFLAIKLREFFNPGQYLVYNEAPLSVESGFQLSSVARKTLVLDLDETLVHSCYVDPDTNDLVGCTYVPEHAVPDYVLHIPIIADIPPIEFQVFKRPFVDEFLNFVGRWYDVVIYTASLEAYATIVIDKLDAGRGIMQRRFYRQHCISTMAVVSKNLYVVSRDLSSVFIIDNSPSAYRDFPENAIPIKSYIYDPKDTELLNLLPFLDALRFTRDVRSILRRRERP